MSHKKYSWVDLPNDDFNLILGYKKPEVTKLNTLIQAYHDIPKDDGDSLHIRVCRLEDIIDHITEWIDYKLCNKDKKKHLISLREIAEKKVNYLLAIIKIFEDPTPIEKILNDYHKDQSQSKDNSYEILFLNKIRMYSIKKQESWGDFWTVTLDPCHRQLTNYLQVWEELKGENKFSKDFFLWLETQHVPNYQPYEDYLSPQELIHYILLVKDGSLKNKNNSLDADFSDSNKKYLFVVDLKKNLYVIEETETMFHSCLCRGKPVLSAGKLVINKGKITHVSFESGHYIPSIKAGYQLFKVLLEQNYELPEKTSVSYFHDRNKYTTEIEKDFFVSFDRFKERLTLENTPCYL